MDEQLLKIGEIAAFFNVSPKALRIYERKGIIKPVKTDPQTGYRYYTAGQVQQLNALLELKTLGFSLEEIKLIMDGGLDGDKFAEALERKKTAWQETISKSENKINAIENIVERLSSSKSETKLRGLSEEERAWQLVKMVCVEDIRGQRVLSEAIWL
jgi:DNA-binding transcriptional MerR regulator